MSLLLRPSTDMSQLELGGELGISEVIIVAVGWGSAPVASNLSRATVLQRFLESYQSPFDLNIRFFDDGEGKATADDYMFATNFAAAFARNDKKSNLRVVLDLVHDLDTYKIQTMSFLGAFTRQSITDLTLFQSNWDHNFQQHLPRQKQCAGCTFPFCHSCFAMALTDIIWDLPNLKILRFLFLHSNILEEFMYQNYELDEMDIQIKKFDGDLRHWIPDKPSKTWPLWHNNVHGTATTWQHRSVDEIQLPLCGYQGKLAQPSEFLQIDIHIPRKNGSVALHEIFPLNLPSSTAPTLQISNRYLRDQLNDGALISDFVYNNQHLQDLHLVTRPGPVFDNVLAGIVDGLRGNQVLQTLGFTISEPFNGAINVDFMPLALLMGDSEIRPCLKKFHLHLDAGSAVDVDMESIKALLKASDFKSFKVDFEELAGTIVADQPLTIEGVNAIQYMLETVLQTESLQEFKLRPAPMSLKDMIKQRMEGNHSLLSIQMDPLQDWDAAFAREIQSICWRNCLIPFVHVPPTPSVLGSALAALEKKDPAKKQPWQSATVIFRALASRPDSPMIAHYFNQRTELEGGSGLEDTD